MSMRIGIDTGGTFTDLVELNDDTGELTVVKCPSTPDDPSRAILQALRQSKFEPEHISQFVLGTTVVINALLQRNGARVLYVTSAGFEDVPFLQRINRRFHYDLNWVRPLPLVRRRDCIGIPERVNYLGQVEKPLSDSDLHNLADLIRQRLDVWSLESGPANGLAIAVNLLFSYVNPAPERRLRDFLQKEFPEIPVSISSDVAPIWREYERASTTLADAFSRPLVGQFVQALQRGLDDLLFDRSWAVMKSNGGQMLSQVAEARPVQMLLSGLSAGIIAGRFIGDLAGSSNVITLDIGGTSTDVGVVVDGRVRFTTEWRIEFGLPVSAPLIDLNTLGAGGGSIAWINKGGVLQVGPQSVGAVPGPACYSQGGSLPTVTDANVVLGLLNPDNFLGGRVVLEPALAHEAIERLGVGLGTDIETTARAIIDVANENIAEAMRLLTVRRGLDPRDFDVVAFGGAGPLHAAAVARSIGVRRVIIPPHPGLASAFGTLLADLRVDKAWTHIVRSDAIDLETINVRLDELVDEALAELWEEGFTGAPLIERSVSARYDGQNYEEEIPLADGPLDKDSFLELLERFHIHYEKIYGYRLEQEIVELVQFTVTTRGATTKPSLPPAPTGSPGNSVGKRQAWFAGAMKECLIYRREDLVAHQQIVGPAIIEELDSTTLVDPDVTFSLTSDGIGILEV